MPTDPKVPIVMVGPGTGVVPYIGFLQEREACGQELGDAHLYFGCRDKDTDFIYRDFMADMSDKKVLSNLHLAFSRAEDKTPKTYVQDLLKSNLAQIRELLLEQRGYFYICGGLKMGTDV